jgi:hypothetical protein
VVYAADGVTPLAHVDVGLDNASPRACTNLSGAYTIASVPLQVPLKVFAGGDNWCPGGPEGYVPEWWIEAFTPAAAAAVTLSTETPAVTGINFTLAQKLFLALIHKP